LTSRGLLTEKKTIPGRKKMFLAILWSENDLLKR
jgi:hypothetical protein